MRSNVISSLRRLLARTIKRPLRFPLPTGDALPRFEHDDPFILFHPYARGRRKSLSNEVIAEFCRNFAPARVVVVGVTRRRFSAPDNCIDLSNQTTLLQLIHLIRKARFFISVDSGPMHIGAAVNDRLISIHTWTDPRRVGPYNENAWVWKNGQLSRVRELPATANKKDNQVFQLKHVAQVAEHARTHFGFA